MRIELKRPPINLVQRNRRPRINLVLVLESKENRLKLGMNPIAKTEEWVKTKESSLSNKSRTVALPSIRW